MKLAVLCAALATLVGAQDTATVEGVVVEENSVVSMGVFIGASTKIYDRATGQVNDVTLSCGQTEKGLLGAFDIRYGHDDWTADYDSHQLWYIGMEPQLKSRVFHIWNHSDDTDYKALLGLVCFDDRTSGPLH